MSDSPSVPGTVLSTTAGQQLRAAREATGLHIVALAAALKVPVRKLEALEADRWSDLTDATFVRALAGSVARHLKMDATPVLAALPAGKTAPIEVPDNLGRASGAGDQIGLPSGIPKVTWFVLAFLLAALALYMLPESVFNAFSQLGSKGGTTEAVTTQASPVRAGESELPSAAQPTDGSVQGKGVIEQPDAPTQPVAPGAQAITSGSVPVGNVLPAPVAGGSAGGTNGAGANPTLTIQATTDTWIEVVGQDGVVRAQRLLKQGDKTEFNDSPSFAVVLGNAVGAKVWVNGNVFDLAPVVKNNIARFEAK